MHHRPDIDGLRSVAVLPVIFFHAGFPGFSGGYVGVDVFFVISGFLITMLLTEDMNRGRFDLLGFYERRARRILPALFVVLAACLPMAWALLTPREMKDFAQSLAATGLFSSNILFWLESGYFASDSELKPLLHTWSLAVEEQFYLVFPPVLWGAALVLWFFVRRNADRILLLLLGTVALASLGLSEWASRHAPDFNFYMLPTRAWELLAGSLLALWQHGHPQRRNPRLALFGLAMIAAAVVLFDSETRVPGLPALLPVLGTVLVLGWGNRFGLAGRLLTSRPFTAIGVISYSAYLWHQPLFAFARIHQGGEPALWIMALLCLLTLALAALSLHLVERPFRNRAFLSRGKVLGLSVLGLAGVTALGAAGHLGNAAYTRNWEARQPEAYRQLVRMVDAADVMLSNFGADAAGNQTLTDCRFRTEALTDEIAERLADCAARFGPGVMVLGDSHAIDLFGMVASRFDLPLLFGVSQGGCRPHDAGQGCHYAGVEDYLATGPGTIRQVIYEQAGFYYLTDTDGSPGSRDMFLRLGLEDPVPAFGIDPEPIRRTADYLGRLARHVPVTWLLPRMEPHITKAQVLRRGCTFDWTLRPGLAETFLRLEAAIEAIATEHEAALTLVSNSRVLSLRFPQDFMSCDALYWTDGDHYTSEGEVRFGARLPEDLTAAPH